MEHIYLSRRNLLVLLNKLDRVEAGGVSKCTIIKQDTTHKKFPCSSECMVTAIEDEQYYDRQPGPMWPEDEPK